MGRHRTGRERVVRLPSTAQLVVTSDWALGCVDEGFVLCDQRRHQRARLVTGIRRMIRARDQFQAATRKGRQIRKSGPADL